MSAERQQELSLATIMQATSVEAHRLAAMAERLDARVGDLAEIAGATDTDTLRALQDMDYLRQALTVLGEVAVRTAESLERGEDPHVDVRAFAEGITPLDIRDLCIWGQVCRGAHPIGMRFE